MSKSVGQDQPDKLVQARRAFEAADFDLAHDLLTDLCRQWPNDQALARNLHTTAQLRHGSSGQEEIQDEKKLSLLSNKSLSQNTTESKDSSQILSPPDPVERYNSALMARCAGQLTDALRLLKPLVEPDDPRGSEKDGRRRKVEGMAERQGRRLWLDLLLTFGDRQGAAQFIHQHRHLHQGDSAWWELEQRAHLSLEDLGEEGDSAHPTACFSRARLALEAGDPLGAMDLVELSEVPGTGWAMHANIACINAHRNKHALAEWTLNIAAVKLKEEAGEGSILSKSASFLPPSPPSSPVARALLEASFTITYHQGLLAHRKGQWIAAWRRLTVCALHERFLHSPYYWMRLGETLVRRRESLGARPGYDVQPDVDPLDPAGPYTEMEERMALDHLLPHLRDVPQGDAYISRFSVHFSPSLPKVTFLTSRKLLLLALLAFRKAQMIHRELPVKAPFFLENLTSGICRSLYLLAIATWDEGEKHSESLSSDHIIEASTLADTTFATLSSQISKEWERDPIPARSGTSQAVAEGIRNSLAFTTTSAHHYRSKPSEIFRFLKDLRPHTYPSPHPPSQHAMVPTQKLLDQMDDLQVANYLWWVFSLHHLVGFPKGHPAESSILRVVSQCMRHVSPEQRSLLTPWYAIFLHQART
ncbi:hypothetical protein BJ684DRAFT_20061 [Piptocephalis cylindrospora]|uniref:Uncharacterized protein n=1 Tax=Piptocephalis cylindrospora TaxID=1907219 RepID=A0A4P9Y3F9_9FUNG|nr:hypothetical protein BJ684DRAFT_20061 [Piptocephalis cylindrospora]|eukprot:RKP13446.1 hypothetical protein BJ684DRAFT_20061 [Piptocephalis cylindrospora]